MSSIGSSDPRLTRTGLESLNGQVSLDELQRREQGPGAQDASLEQLRGTTPESPRELLPATDAGEDVLNAAAWEGVADGQRMLAGDRDFEARLGAMDLSSAADSAADAILGEIG